MTDNPIEVQEEIERARTDMRYRVGERIEEMLLHNANVFGEEAWVDAIAEIAVQEADEYRTAILKHDPVVTGFDDVAGDAERLIALLRIILPTEDRMPSGTFEAIDAVQGRLQRVLEVYRTAVSDGERPQD